MTKEQIKERKFYAEKVKVWKREEAFAAKMRKTYEDALAGKPNDHAKSTYQLEVNCEVFTRTLREARRPKDY